MTRHLSAVVLGLALAGPMVLTTTTPSEGAAITVRVYDREHRDYHRWDRGEERAYRHYLSERHRAYARYARQRQAERRTYWRWRHEQWERERR
jgi:exonuclease VII large subunit